MNSELIVILLTSSASLAFLWIFYFWLYKGYMVDLFRQNMFILRDNLFDEAAEGMIEFDHPAYGTMRRTMNGFIRFAHGFDLLHAIFLLFTDDEQLAKSDSYSFDKRLSRAMQGLPPETVERMHYYRVKMQKELLFHCFRVSIFLSVLLTIPVAVVILLKGLQKFKNFMLQHLKGIESAALSHGQLN